MSLQDTTIATPRYTGDRVVVGLDFGTHSTKVVIRERGNERGFVPVIDFVTDAYPQFTSPSACCIDSKGRMWFGHAAVVRQKSALLNSLKSLLLKSLSEKTYDLSLEGPTVKTGCYLAWLIGRITNSLAPYPRERIEINIAAPMDFLDDENLKNKYLQMLTASMALLQLRPKYQIKQSESADELHRCFIRAWSNRIPHDESRTFTVLSESKAPIVSFYHSPQSMQGYYFLMDMGAGTTEISCNHLLMGAEPKIICKSAKTFGVGFEQFLANSESTKPLEDELESAMRKTWYEAYNKMAHSVQQKRSRNEIKNCFLVLSGGGFLDKQRRLHVSGYNPTSCVDQSIKNSGFEIYNMSPKNLDYDSSIQNSKELDRILACANGLAYPRRYWVDFFGPSQALCDSHNEFFELTQKRYHEEDVG